MKDEQNTGNKSRNLTPIKTPVKGTDTALARQRKESTAQKELEKSKKKVEKTDDIKTAVLKRRAAQEELAKIPQEVPVWAQERIRKLRPKSRKSSKTDQRNNIVKKIAKKEKIAPKSKLLKKKLTKQGKSKKLQGTRSRSTMSAPAKDKQLKSDIKGAVRNSNYRSKSAAKMLSSSVDKNNGSLNKIITEIKSLKNLINDNSRKITAKQENILKGFSSKKSVQSVEKLKPTSSSKDFSSSQLLKAICEALRHKAPVELKYQLIEWVRQHYGNKNANQIMEEIGLPTPDRKVSGSVNYQVPLTSKNGKKDTLSLDKKKFSTEVTNTRSLLRKRDLRGTTHSINLEPVRPLKGRPRKSLKQEEGEVRVAVNEKIVDSMYFMPNIDHEEVKMIEDDLKQEVNSDNVLNSQNDKNSDTKNDLHEKDDVLAIGGDNQSVNLTMQFSVNEDQIKKPYKHLSEAGSQH